MDSALIVGLRRYRRWKLFLRCWMPQTYLRMERRRIEGSRWLTEEEKREKVWLLEHTIGRRRA